MKSSKSIRIGMMSIVVLVAFSFVSKAFGAYDAYLYIKDSKGKVTRITIHHDGTFQTGPLAPGIYSFSWGVGRAVTIPAGGSADRESSSPSVSEIAVKKPGDRASTSSGGDRPQESLSLNFTKIEFKCQVQDRGEGDPDRPVVTGKRMHQPISIMKEIDKSSPKLMTALGTVTIDQKGETVSGTVSGTWANGNKTSADSWDAK